MKEYDVSKFPRCFITADIVLLSIKDGELAVLLIKRKENPFKNLWALPGGFLNVLEDQDALITAKRELQEETGLKNIYVEQLKTYTAMNRDPREAIANEPIRIASIAHFALIDCHKVNAVAGSDAKEVSWFKISEIPSLAFDHSIIIKDAVDRVRGKINYTNVGFELLPEKFTIPELQNVIESVIGYSLDRNNFRTKVLSLDILIDTKEKKNDGGKGKPSSLYKVDKSKIDVLKHKWLF